jgi:hypothetical protein
VDGVRSEPCDEIREDRLALPLSGSGSAAVTFSPDGRHYVYEVRNQGRLSIVLDGKEIPGDGFKSSFLFSPDSQRSAYVLSEQVGTNEWTTCVVVDGIKGKEFDGSVEDLDFTPDSKQLIYRARAGHYVEHGKTFFVVNGKPQRQYDLILTGFAQGLTGNHLAYVGDRTPLGRKVISWVKDKMRSDAEDQGEQRFLVVDGKETKLPEGTSVEGIGFSPDGKHWGCIVESEKENIALVDGRKVGAYEDKISASKAVIFSPDSHHFAFHADRADECLLVLDGEEKVIEGEWLINSQIEFDSPTHLHGLIMRGYEFIRLEIELGKN